MHFQNNFSSPIIILFFILLAFNVNSGLCIFKTWFSSGTKENASVTGVGPFQTKRQSSIDIGSDTLPMKFGEECETNGRSCNEADFLECIDGKCMCKNPMSHLYDEANFRCVGLSGAQCGAGKPECVANSRCMFGSCQCLDKYGETSTKVCMRNHRQSCSPGECNGDNGLACMRGSCQCIDSSLVFDPFTSKCVNPQVEFDKFSRTVGRNVVQRVIARTLSDATSLVFLPLRLLIPGFG
ncbi:Tenascin-N [Folsomia candida]|uniref:Tenascin-N n=1 Tax=Folsomia candida TaxID=158441 RepID=A0A226EM75_FOLCA|nr:Tenascin-N [Folsomia candida]